MWIPRLSSLVLLAASVATGYTLVMFIANDSLPSNVWVVGAVIGVIFAVVGTLAGLGGIALSFIVEPDGEGQFRVRQGELTDMLYPRRDRTRNEGYCKASMKAAWRIASILFGIFAVGLCGYVAYESVANNLTLAMYAGGGLVALIVIIVLCVASKVFRTLLACFLGGSAGLGVVWLVHSLDWASAGQWTVATGTATLPWAIGLVGGIALFFVVRFFMRTKAYRTMCPTYTGL